MTVKIVLLSLVGLWIFLGFFLAFAFCIVSGRAERHAQIQLAQWLAEQQQMKGAAK